MHALPSPDALRSALAVADRNAVGRAYPEPLRRAAVAFATAARRRGETIASIAATLGLPAITLQRWLRREQESPFRAAIIVEPATPFPAGSPIVVHAPGGVRIEGLDVAGLAELLRRLA